MKITLIRLLFLKNFWKTIWELIYIWYIKKYVKHYTHIDYLPLFNFAEIMKGKFEFLFEGKKTRRVPRIFFVKIFEEMNYQFKALDTSNLKDKADLAVYEYKYVIATDKRIKSRWLNEFNTLKKKIENKKRTPFDLNEFVQYIELSFKQPIGSFDIYMSTSRAFSAYQKAIKLSKASR